MQSAIASAKKVVEDIEKKMPFGNDLLASIEEGKKAIEDLKSDGQESDKLQTDLQEVGDTMIKKSTTDNFGNCD